MRDRGGHDPWWLETFELTRAVFGILFWPLAAIIGVIVVLGLLFVAFESGVLWGLLVLGGIAATIAGFAWWERRQPPRL
ncbi:MAG: hypothetical protein WD379_04210 [Dehalococcoidia bacterium]